MGRRVISACAAMVAAVAFAGSAAPQPPSAAYTVHEWGTFTSIAGQDGQAVTWQPQSGPVDLPCFVEHSPLILKGALSGTVRMETPVLYFYSPREIEVSVHVGFSRGLVTEWYPHAEVTRTGSALLTMNGAIDWPRVLVTPGAADAWPRESAASHYYTARETASDPVRVGTQAEKFLFYRGVGQFQPPLSAIAQPDGGVTVHNVAGRPLGDIILFENRRGAMAFTSRHVAAAADAVLTRPSLDDASGAPLTELRRILVADGLYEQEAQAMVDTWKDSWFEEGSRLLYIVPRADTDAILPLTLSPAPSAIARVFVGRIELITPATLRDVSQAFASNDRAVLARYGRFLQPIAASAGLAVAPPSVAAPACR